MAHKNFLILLMFTFAFGLLLGCKEKCTSSAECGIKLYRTDSLNCLFLDTSFFKSPYIRYRDITDSFTVLKIVSREKYTHRLTIFSNSVKSLGDITKDKAKKYERYKERGPLFLSAEDNAYMDVDSFHGGFVEYFYGMSGDGYYYHNLDLKYYKKFGERIVIIELITDRTTFQKTDSIRFVQFIQNMSVGPCDCSNFQPCFSDN